MKNLKLFSILIVFIISIFAATASLDMSEVKLGGTNQERGINTSVSITITNSGDATVDNFQLSFPGVNSKYQISGQFSGTEILPGESITLVVEGYVPLDLDAVNTMGKKISVDIGDVFIKGAYPNATEVSKTANLLMEAENKLEFASSEIKINEDVKTLRDGKSYSSIKRNDDIELSLEVENNFDRDGDCQDDGTNCDVEDIEIRAESRDSDLDVDESTDISSLRAERSSIETMSFSIPDDADSDDYDIEIWVTGDDENGARHGDYWEITLEVDVARDEVTINSFELNPEILNCDQTHATLSVVLENTGKDDQTRIALAIESSSLNIAEAISYIELDESDRITKTFDLNLPNKLSPGNYYIRIIGYVNNNDETDREMATLTIRECQITPPVEEDDGNDNTGSDVNIIEIPPTAGVIYSTPKQTSIFEGEQYVLLLGGMFVIGLLLLIILLAILLKK